jgi:hypothetical protein
MKRHDGTGENRHSPWRDLDIDPTSDIRAVRSAYARKLKAIDVESDSAAFISLRRHFDRAMLLAARLPAGNAVRMEYSSAPATSESLQRSPALQPVDRSEADGSVSFERLTQEVQQLLWQPPNTERDVHLCEATRALLESPLLENIDRAAFTERWFAAALLDAIPRSDAIIAIVSDHYHWHERVAGVRELPGLPSIIQRREDIACSQRLRRTDHDWHAAYSYLQASIRPSVTDEQKRTLGNQIAEMLESIRYYHPTVESELDGGHVAYWDRLIGEAKTARKAEKKIQPTFLQNIFGFIPYWGWMLILLALSALVAGDPPPPR